jgi:hypothetical protein
MADIDQSRTDQSRFDESAPFSLVLIQKFSRRIRVKIKKTCEPPRQREPGFSQSTSGFPDVQLRIGE